MQNYGPFGVIVTMVGAILSTIYAIWTLIWRRKIWATPQQVLPPQARGLIAVLAGIVLVFLLINIFPCNVNTYLKWALILGAILLISFLLYFALVRSFTYKKVSALPGNQTITEDVLGGFWLRKVARKELIKKKITVQELFARSAYDEDKLWSRISREATISSIVLLYITLAFSGIVSISSAGFVAQVKMTNKSVLPQPEITHQDLNIEADFIDADNNPISSISEDTINKMVTIRTINCRPVNTLLLEFQFAAEHIARKERFRFKFREPFVTKLGGNRGSVRDWDIDSPDGVWYYTCKKLKPVVSFSIDYLN